MPSILGLYSLTLEQLESLTLEELYALELESTEGLSYLSNSVDLYIQGGFGSSISKTLDLYLQAPSGVGTGLQLYLKGIDSLESSLNLFLGAKTAQSSNSISLFTQGSTSGYQYQFNSMPLYINGEGLYSNLNLFIEGKNQPGSYDSSMNLYLEGKGENVNNSLDLSIWGSSGDEFYGYYLDSSASLYIEGTGELSESIPASGTMNLYLQGVPGVERGLDLFLKGPDGVENNINLFLNGITGNFASGINLYMNSTGVAASGINLYLRGHIEYP